MKKILSVLLVLLMVVVSAQIVMAKDKAAKPKASDKAVEKPGAIAVETVSATATVASINAEKREITLKTVDGNSKTFKLGPEVKNFDQIKVGDQVKATYAESIAVYVAKSNEKPSADEVQVIQVAPKGEKPGLFMADTFEISAKVEKIDYKKREITLKGSDDKTKKFPVDKRVKNFKNIKVGDEVVMKITEAIAIYVEKP